MTSFSFTREYRLKSRKGIDDLFLKGKRIKEFPFSLIYAYYEERSHPNLKIGLSVPKRSVPKAVDRNKIKRLMRESIRLNITELYSDISGHAKKINVMIIYHGNKDIKYANVENKIILLLKRFKDQISI